MNTEGNKQNNNILTIYFSVILTLMIAIMIVAVDIIMPKLEVHVVEKVTMEAGTDFPSLEQFFDKDSKNLSFAKPLETFIDKNVPGKYEIGLFIGDKECSSVLEIVDTTAPVVVVKSATIQSWETISVDSLVESVTDLSETTVEFESVPDFTQVGIHDVSIIVKDASGNSSTVVTKVEVLPDEVAPVITGVKDIVVMLGDTISYRKDIQVSDNSGQKISIQIDNSKVDTTKPGTYTVYYSASDAAGNVTTAEAKVVIKNVVTPTEVALTPYLDDIISKVTNANMSTYDKAYALWNWCRRNIRYSHSSGNRDTIWHGVYEGVYKHYGDCYAYYATYSALLTRCGIENLCVARINGTSNHWWNLVKLESGWYHCDSSPRTLGDPYLCFMQTDAQVAAYTANHVKKPNYYTFDPSLYPERATEIIFGN